MDDSRQLLSAILSTTQTGQVSIRSMLKAVMQPELRSSIQRQLHEYDTIERMANAIACARGWELDALEPADRLYTALRTRMKLRKDHSDSALAAFLIRSSTQFIIDTLTQQHSLDCGDSQVAALWQKHLDCQQAGIRRLQDFL